MRFNPARFQPANGPHTACGVAAKAGAMRGAAPALQPAGGSAHHAAPPGAEMV